MRSFGYGMLVNLVAIVVLGLAIYDLMFAPSSDLRATVTMLAGVMVLNLGSLQESDRCVRQR